jgi:hypothetical protein
MLFGVRDVLVQSWWEDHKLYVTVKHCLTEVLIDCLEKNERKRERARDDRLL